MAKPVRENGVWTCTHHFDQKLDKWITDDGHWLWDPGLRRECGSRGDWYPNPANPETTSMGEVFAPLFGNQQQERTVSMYVWTIGVIKNASQDEQKAGKSSVMLIKPEAIVANEQMKAVLLFGAKHADALEGVSGDLLTVQVRQGV